MSNLESLQEQLRNKEIKLLEINRKKEKLEKTIEVEEKESTDKNALELIKLKELDDDLQARKKAYDHEVKEKKRFETISVRERQKKEAEEKKEWIIKARNTPAPYRNIKEDIKAGKDLCYGCLLPLNPENLHCESNLECTVCQNHVKYSDKPNYVKIEKFNRGLKEFMFDRKPCPTCNELLYSTTDKIIEMRVDTAHNVLLFPTPAPNMLYCARCVKSYHISEFEGNERQDKLDTLIEETQKKSLVLSKLIDEYKAKINMGE